jgi:hypothetical protein
VWCVPSIDSEQAKDVKVDPFVLNIILEIVKAIVGVIVPALTVWLMFHTKRINDNTKRNFLQGKVDQLAQHTEQLQSFQDITFEERIDAIMEAAKREVLDHKINISDVELKIMVESSLSTLRSLDNIGLRLSKEKHGKTIEK